MTDPHTSPGAGAVRLVFDRQGEDVTLVSQQRVDIDVTGFDAAPHAAAGHYVEVRATDGSGLTRVPIHGGFHDSVEVFPEDHTEAITRVPDAGGSRVFSVVVPARSDAHSVAVIRVEAAPEASAAPATDAADAEGEDAAAPAALATTELASFELDA